jgi:hypothetical protein
LAASLPLAPPATSPSATTSLLLLLVLMLLVVLLVMWRMAHALHTLQPSTYTIQHVFFNIVGHMM